MRYGTRSTTWERNTGWRRTWPTPYAAWPRTYGSARWSMSPTGWWRRTSRSRSFRRKAPRLVRLAGRNKSLQRGQTPLKSFAEETHEISHGRGIVHRGTGGRTRTGRGDSADGAADPGVRRIPDAGIDFLRGAERHLPGQQYQRRPHGRRRQWFHLPGGTRWPHPGAKVDRWDPGGGPPQRAQGDGRRRRHALRV